MPYKCRDCGTEVEIHPKGAPCIACNGTDLIETVAPKVVVPPSDSMRGTFTKREPAPEIKRRENACCGTANTCSKAESQTAQKAYLYTATC